jgi:hypothetical protein
VRALEAHLNRPVEGWIPFKVRFGFGVSQAGLRRNGVVRSAVIHTSPVSPGAETCTFTILLLLDGACARYSRA